MLKIEEENKSLAFAILIGGMSTRFGSDKGIFEFLGKSLISYQIDTIVKFNMSIFLVAHSQEQVQKYRIKIETENIKDFFLDDLDLISNKELRTPMIGLYTAFKELNQLEYEKVFILSCDAPLIKHNVIELLIKQSKSNDCCIPQWNNKFLEPLFAIYPIKKALKNARENIKNETYKLTNILDESWKINYISIENEIQPLDNKLISLININGPVDIDKLINIYKKDRILNNN